MPTSYCQLSKEERIKLEAYLLVGLTQKECARRLGRDPGTISRELKRNSIEENVSIYEAKIAHKKSTKRKRKLPKKLEVNLELQEYVVSKLLINWSPEQISGRLEVERGYPVIHFDTIYWWIYQERRDLIIWLRHGKKQRWRRKHGTRMREKARELSKKRWIHDRPKIIEKRARVGDWEGDTVVGRADERDRLVTYTDRKTGFLISRKIDTGAALDFHIATKIAFKKIPKTKKLTCTYDNGSEMANHELIERDTKMTIYFAHAYASWERGTNENTNGLLREYFPKRSSFANLGQKQVDEAVKLINNRPRKRLNYRTPYEVFTNCT